MVPLALTNAKVSMGQKNSIFDMKLKAKAESVFPETQGYSTPQGSKYLYGSFQKPRGHT